MNEWVNESCGSSLMTLILLCYWGNKNWNPARWMLPSNSSSIQTRKGNENQRFAPRVLVQITEVNSSIYIRINTNIEFTQTRINHAILYWFKLLTLITSEIIEHFYKAHFSPLYYNALQVGTWLYQVTEEQTLGIFTSFPNM